MKTLTLLCTLIVSGFVLTSGLHANYPCAPQTLTISGVPYHITNDNAHNNTTYCVTTNLVLGVAGQPAITIDAGVHDIIIDFNGYDLTLPTTETGIQMLGTQASPVSNVLIKNGLIQASAVSTNANSNAIALTLSSSTTIAAASNNVDLSNNPSGVINVASTTGFNPLGGTITVVTSAGPQPVNYTTITTVAPFQFTGVTGGTGVMSTNGTVIDGVKAVDWVTIENMRFSNTRRGVALFNQNDLGSNLTVRSCEFNHPGDGSTRGISLSTIQGLLVEDCSFMLSSSGASANANVCILFANNSINATIQRCQFNGGPAPTSTIGSTAGITIQSVDSSQSDAFFFTFESSNFLIDQCEFDNLTSSDVVASGAKNVQVSNCTFRSNPSVSTARETVVFTSTSDGFVLGSKPVISSGLIVDHCTFHTQAANGGPNAGPRGLRIGANVIGFSPSTNLITHDCIVRNCTFTHLNAPSKYNDILASWVDGILIERCVFDSNSSGRVGCTPITNNQSGLIEKSANIHLGYAASGNAKNVTIRGNQIGGGAQVGIFVDGDPVFGPCEHIVIKNNNITAAEQGILLNNTIDAIVRGNYISGVNGSFSGGIPCAPGVGIELAGATANFPTASSSCNAILGNTVVNNGTGILIDLGAHGNLIKANKAFNNSMHQIHVVDKANNMEKRNTTFKVGTPCSATPTAIGLEAAPASESHDEVNSEGLLQI